MSWPSDGLPRYKAAYLGDCAYVYDRAACHAIVASFISNSKLQTRAKARAHAVDLNRLHDPQWRVAA